MTLDNFYANECQACGSRKTVWRRGIHFDHLRRCSNCEFSYDPDDSYAEMRENTRKREEERLALNTSRE